MASSAQLAPEGRSEPYRALVSLSEVDRAAGLVGALVRFGWEVWASEGTAARLAGHGIVARRLSELTGITQALGGRLKTLHPRVFAGVLARATAEDLREVSELGGVPFDLVVVEFYPFEEAAGSGQGPAGQSAGPVDLHRLVELIDIGGPALVRAAAKNFARVTVVCHPAQYDEVQRVVEQSGGRPPGLEVRRRLAAEAFERTAAYDAAVARVLGSRLPAEGTTEVAFPPVLTLSYVLWQRARYGENPHQPGAIYRTARQVPSVPWAQVLQGKELSYNNVADAQAAWSAVLEFSPLPAACAVKHGTPCGVAVGKTLAEAYERAHAADPVSIFGGVVGLNQPVDRATAQLLVGTFLEVVVAPAFTPEAREVLASRPKLRLIEVGAAEPAPASLEVRSIPGGLLVQHPDTVDLDEARLSVVTRTPVPERLWPDLRFAWKVAKHARSNAIVVAKDGQTLGIGAGQVSRIDAARLALGKAGERASGAVLASDGFFPFSDVVELCASCGIAAIIQPGGSVRDQESISAADQAGIAMVMTGIRHFRH